MSFPNVPVGDPFSTSTVFEISREEMCQVRVNGKPIRQILHRFQNVPASCDGCLRRKNLFGKIIHLLDTEFGKMQERGLYGYQDST